MIRFSCMILKFGEQGEKTGWTYITIPAHLAEELLPGNKKSFRVKGRLDDLQIEKQALIPMGDGDFILPLNAGMRKVLRKREGTTLEAEIGLDTREIEIDGELLACLRDEPGAIENFKRLPASHQRYFSRWIQEAKTDATRAKRITQAVIALSRNQGFGEMIRENKGSSKT
jgi:hypothetical protein